MGLKELFGGDTKVDLPAPPPLEVEDTTTSDLLKNKKRTGRSSLVINPMDTGINTSSTGGLKL